MLALAKPLSIQYPRAKLQTNKKIIKRPVRNVRVQAALPDPDLTNYTLFQLTSWVLPMTIAGRLMKMEYNEIAVGLVALAVAKTALEAGGIIHY
jgi:hypothetical protein